MSRHNISYTMHNVLTALSCSSVCSSVCVFSSSTSEHRSKVVDVIMVMNVAAVLVMMLFILIVIEGSPLPV
jgi:hypothetical protein